MLKGWRNVWLVCGAVLAVAGCNKGGEGAKSAGGDPCATANFKNDAAKFCLTLPAGFKAGAAEKDFQAIDLPGGGRLAMSWQAPGPAMSPEIVDSLAGDGKVVEKGDLPGGKGKWIVYDEKANPTRHVDAIVKGTNAVRCATNGDVAQMAESIAACKTLSAN